MKGKFVRALIIPNRLFIIEITHAIINMEIVDAVKTVLVLGKRTLPLYVNEHDCIDCGSAGYDIISIVVEVLNTESKEKISLSCSVSKN